VRIDSILNQLVDGDGIGRNELCAKLKNCPSRDFEGHVF
jgi:hypothetical protein